MPVFTKVAGAWKQLSKPYVKVAGVWKEAKLFVKASGVWRLVGAVPVTITLGYSSGPGVNVFVQGTLIGTLSSTGQQIVVYDKDFVTLTAYSDYEVVDLVARRTSNNTMVNMSSVGSGELAVIQLTVTENLTVYCNTYL